MTKNKLIVAGSTILATASSAFGAVTVDNASGVVSGTADLNVFFAAFGVAMVAGIAFWAAKKGLRLFN